MVYLLDQARPIFAKLCSRNPGFNKSRYLVVGGRFFPESPRLVRAITVVPDELSQPIQRRKGSGCSTVLGGVDYFGDTVFGLGGGDVGHAFLRNRRPDYILRRPFNSLLVGWPLVFQHLEDFQAKCGFQVRRVRPWSDRKSAISVKTTISGDDVQMGVEVLKIPKSLHRDHRSRNGVVKGGALLQVAGQHRPGTLAHLSLSVSANFRPESLTRIL